MRTLPAVIGLVLIAAPSVAPAQELGAVTIEVGARDPAVHPAGRTLAMSVLGDVWLLPLGGGDAHQVTSGPSWDARPAWSPDGQFLAYAHRLPNGTHIAILNLATGGTRFLYHTEFAIGQILFSPDGRDLYFINDRNQYDAHVWRVPVAGGDAEQVTHTRNWHEWSFALSPDGDRLLLESGRYGGADLYEIALDDGAIVRHTRTVAREMSVVWAPDGSRRAWVETHNGIDHVIVEREGATRRVFSSAFDDKQLAAHPDGRTLVMAAGRRLYRLDTVSGSAVPIPFRVQLTVRRPDPGTLAITDVRLFDPIAGQVFDQSTVVIRDGRVVRVRQGGDATPPAGATVVDGRGRTLVPGLIDNHYHYWSPFAGSTLLARGITAVRDPGVSIADGMDFKHAIRVGALQGPDIFSAGPLLDGPGGYHPRVDISLDDPAAAAPLVQALKDQGVDLLKVYFLLEPELVQAVVREAHAVGLPVTGHIGVRTSWGEAMDAGIDGFNHVRVWRDFLPPELQPTGEDESLDGQRNPVARMQADWNRIDPEGEEIGALIARMVESGTALDPTLFIQRIGDNARSRFSLEQFATVRDGFHRMQRFVSRAVEAGVTLLAGTDNVNLFDELEAYAEAGVPTVEILRAATINGARWLGREREFGSIEEGKRANLVLVDGDPLEDISALRHVDLVVQDGVSVFRR